MQEEACALAPAAGRKAQAAPRRRVAPKTAEADMPSLM
jgi:hypothetical protein